MKKDSYEWVYKSYCSITANKHPYPVPRNTKICDNLLVTAPEEETEKLLVIAEFLLASVTTLAVEPFLCAALDSLNQLGYTVTPDATGKLILLDRKSVV